LASILPKFNQTGPNLINFNKIFARGCDWGG